MSFVRGFFKEYGKHLVWLTVAGFVMTLAWYRPWERDPVQFLKIGALCATLWIVMWLGNNWIAHLVDARISWKEKPVMALVVGMVATLIFTVAAVYFYAGLFYVVMNLDISDDIVGIFYVSLAITIVITLFMHGRSFLYSWRETAITAERLQKESIRSQYESLRNQVNPHFLFNSLNALTNLVYEDPDKAVKFIKQLSDVYRYVLDTRDRELVDLQEELKFLDAYLFLQQIRFGAKLRVDIDLKADQKVAPLVLQMLIENAIKHNVISEENPLAIRMFQDNGWVIVENNRKIKKTLPEESTGVGLANIRNRYAYFTDKAVQVVSDADKFTVRLPVIQTTT